MIIVNKRTKEKMEISYSEFYVLFRKEICDAFESYEKSELAKPYFKTNDDIEGDFKFNLQWNFNHYTNSNWYIEKIS